MTTVFLPRERRACCAAVALRAGVGLAVALLAGLAVVLLAGPANAAAPEAAAEPGPE